MSRRGAVGPVVLAALLLVATAGGSSPAARPGPGSRTVDLLASAHPTSAEPVVSEAAFDHVRLRDHEVAGDTAAITSTVCNGCGGESSALHVVYLPRSHRARLDNVANAWAQDCQDCTSTALSVQVVVMRGRPVTVPNNRALSLTAACTSCRTSALAFQVVLVADHAEPLGEEAVAELRAWFDAQAAAQRASVAGPATVPESPSPTDDPSPTPVEPTPGAAPTDVQPDGQRSARRARKDAVSALDELRTFLAQDLDAETVAADVELSR